MVQLEDAVAELERKLAEKKRELREAEEELVSSLWIHVTRGMPSHMQHTLTHTLPHHTLLT